MTLIRNWALVIAAAATLLVQGLRLLPESSTVARGSAAANSQGCIDCHGRPEPGFPDDAYLSCASAIIDASDRHYDGLCSDLLAYFEVVRLKRTFSRRASSDDQNRLLQGESLARQYNCFQCHGELGQGGFRNAGALKGYIPGYFGTDFMRLTRGADPDSVRAWIREGVDPTLISHGVDGALAKFFIERQAVAMPIFASLPDESIRVLTDYVLTLNHLGAMDAKAIRAYGHETQRIRSAVSVRPAILSSPVTDEVVLTHGRTQIRFARATSAPSDIRSAAPAKLLQQCRQRCLPAPAPWTSRDWRFR